MWVMIAPRQPPSVRTAVAKPKPEPTARIRQLMESLQGGGGNKEQSKKQQLNKPRVVERADNNNEKTPNTSSEYGMVVDPAPGPGRGTAAAAAAADSLLPREGGTSEKKRTVRPKLDRIHLSNDGLYAIGDEEGGGEAHLLPKV